MEERYDALIDLISMPAIKFAMKYDEVLINDGKITYVREKYRKTGMVNDMGRRTYKVGF